MNDASPNGASPNSASPAGFTFVENQAFDLTPEVLRALLYPLDPDHVPAHRELYTTVRSQYILSKEGWVPQAYQDVLGLVTVGIGFNMDRPDAREEWHQAFGQGTVDFDAVYRGERVLAQEEGRHLFAAGLALREQALRASYGDVWDGLRPNERLATESAYYNGACLVQGPLPGGDPTQLPPPTRTSQRSPLPGITRYYGHLEKYVSHKNPDFLSQAVVELRDHSNRRGIRGLALRRAEEACLLSSFEIPEFPLSF